MGDDGCRGGGTGTPQGMRSVTGRAERSARDSRRASGSLRVWACGCSHVAADKAAGRKSLADAIRQSETGNGNPDLAFDRDVCLNL